MGPFICSSIAAMTLAAPSCGREQRTLRQSGQHQICVNLAGLRVRKSGLLEPFHSAPGRLDQLYGLECYLNPTRWPARMARPARHSFALRQLLSDPILGWIELQAGLSLRSFAPLNPVAALPPVSRQSAIHPAPAGRHTTPLQPVAASSRISESCRSSHRGRISFAPMGSTNHCNYSAA